MSDKPYSFEMLDIAEEGGTLLSITVSTESSRKHDYINMDAHQALKDQCKELLDAIDTWELAGHGILTKGGVHVDYNKAVVELMKKNAELRSAI